MSVDKAVEDLDRLAQDEAGRKALGEIADRLSRLFGGHAFTKQTAVPPRPRGLSSLSRRSSTSSWSTTVRRRSMSSRRSVR